LDVDSKYYYRRSLTVRELLPAVGAAAAAAVATFYVVKVLIERTPLESRDADAPLARHGRQAGARLATPQSRRSVAVRNLGRR